LETSVGALERYWKPLRENEKAQGGGPERCIWLKRNRTADLGAQEGFS